MSRLQQFSKADACYERALAIAVAHNLQSVEALCMAGQGALLCRQGQLDAGIELYNRSNAIFLGIGNHFQVARHWFLTGVYAVSAQDFALAESFFHQAREAAEQHQFTSLAWQIYEQLAELCEAQERHKEALSWLRRRMATREQVINERTEERLRVLRASYHIDIIKQEAALSMARSEQLAGINRELQEAILREQSLRQQVETLATTDSLTGLRNRRYWESQANEACLRHGRHQHNIVVALLDIDHFKRINDTFGHGVGDEVLQHFSQRMRVIFRETDAIGRYGGEEFCILFEGYTSCQVYVACERLIHNLHTHPIPSRKGPLWVTVSIGIASADSVAMLLQNADRALYQAKNMGRDRIMVDVPMTSTERVLRVK